jgi:branched-chain amino acid transport system ATP-binding protein
MFEYFPRILERAQQLAGTLSGGEQQMLAIARALMSRPKLLLLDEPTMGLSPMMVDNIFDVIRKISQQGMTIFLVEQNANIALAMSDRAYVMESGEITMTGTGEDLIQDPRIHAAYLGA